MRLDDVCGEGEGSGARGVPNSVRQHFCLPDRLWGFISYTSGTASTK